MSIEFLPCQFQNNIEECNKDVYFDPIIKSVTLDNQQCKKSIYESLYSVKEVSLQGRKMVGRDVTLPAGYSGFIMGKLN